MTPNERPPGRAEWEPELDELARRRRLAEEMGGEAKVERQHSRGKLTVRERIHRLLDDDSFREFGRLAGTGQYAPDGELESFQPTNMVAGRGRIDGRTVVVEGDDFTVRGGAADATIWEKLVMAEQMATELHLPLIRLLDGTGGGGSVKMLDAPDARTYVPYNPGWEHVVANLETVPVVALALGPVAGLGAARLVSSHLSIMVRELSQVFVAGPPVVNHLGVEEVDKEALGGWKIHARNGVVDALAEDEDEAFAIARRFLSYLPSSIDEVPARVEPTDDPRRIEPQLRSVVPRDPRTVYQMRTIIESVVDDGSFFETGSTWGRPAITGLARLDGWPVAILANDPFHYGGGWTAEAAQKVIRFVDLAETFRLPVVNLVDNPGFVIGTEAERAGTIRHGTRALTAVYQASVPWCSILVRRVFGVAGAAHSNRSRFQYRYAWPSGDFGSLPIEGGIQAAYRAELEQAADPNALLAEITERLDRVRSPFRTAEGFLVEDIIDPADTRPLLCEFAGIAAPLRSNSGARIRYRP